MPSSSASNVMRLLLSLTPHQAAPSTAHLARNEARTAARLSEVTRASDGPDISSVYQSVTAGTTTRRKIRRSARLFEPTELP
jgi:uncharacterized membrane-anchored protein